MAETLFLPVLDCQLEVLIPNTWVSSVEEVPQSDFEDATLEATHHIFSALPPITMATHIDPLKWLPETTCRSPQPWHDHKPWAFLSRTRSCARLIFLSSWLPSLYLISTSTLISDVLS